jgi:hypothetical protein
MTGRLSGRWPDSQDFSGVRHFDESQQRGAELKKRRLETKRAIRDAADDQAAWDALKKVTWS